MRGKPPTQRPRVCVTFAVPPGSRLVHLDADVSHQLSILLVVAPDQGGELRSRGGIGFQSPRGVEPAPCFSLGERLVDLGMKPGEYRLRRSSGREQAQPDRDLVAGIELRNGRKIR